MSLIIFSHLEFNNGYALYSTLSSIFLSHPVFPFGILLLTMPPFPLSYIGSPSPSLCPTLLSYKSRKLQTLSKCSSCATVFIYMINWCYKMLANTTKNLMSTYIHVALPSIMLLISSIRKWISCRFTCPHYDIKVAHSYL